MTAIKLPKRPTNVPHADNLTNARFHPRQETIQELCKRVRRVPDWHPDDLTSLRAQTNSAKAEGAFVRFFDPQVDEDGKRIVPRFRFVVN